VEVQRVCFEERAEALVRIADGLGELPALRGLGSGDHVDADGPADRTQEIVHSLVPVGRLVIGRSLQDLIQLRR
jgi:hypothetical protein